MNHEEWLVLVSAYHDGEVTAGERAQVESHLAACAECTELLADCRRFGRTLHDLPRGDMALGMMPGATFVERTDQVASSRRKRVTHRGRAVGCCGSRRDGRGLALDDSRRP